jgi:ubiquinone/menaquinone biosynthesis C-methylase UbiE
MLSKEEVRTVYDRLGAALDWLQPYEHAARAELIAHADLEHARSVFEFGCGTGRFAELLLEHHLPESSRYQAVDLSPRMVALARKRLGRFGSRVTIGLTEGEIQLDLRPATVDRFLSTYVLDLLSSSDILALIAEARRVLTPHGLLGLISLTHGFTAASRLVERAWRALHARRPSLVGGCRPISLADVVTGPGWRVRHRRLIASLGVPSEVVAVEKL